MINTTTIIELDPAMQTRLRLRQGEHEIVLTSDETAVLRNRLLDVSIWQSDHQFPRCTELLTVGLNELNCSLAPLIAKADRTGSELISDLMTMKLNLNKLAHKR